MSDREKLSGCARKTRGKKRLEEDLLDKTGGGTRRHTLHNNLWRKVVPWKSQQRNPLELGKGKTERQKKKVKLSHAVKGLTKSLGRLYSS